MKEIRFFAMMRSGQHAVINWLLAQLPEHTFCNDPLSLVPLCFFKNQNFGGKLSKHDDSFLVYNIEDRFLTAGIEECKEKIYDHSVERDKDIINVLILRDPFNMFASRYARETGRKNLATGEKQHEDIARCFWSPLGGWTSQQALECWKDHAKEIMRPTNMNLIINYNSWATDEDYRKQISEFFEVEFNDIAFKETAIVQGEGSSFDGTNKVESSKTLNRYKRYKYDKYFMSLFDKEINDMAKEIFGWNILQKL
jgi:hypothetical protein